uniref:Uncharacterized protein n=1 Tax=Odontella aurita TaxID=265563 RepID=A0A7S4JI05_9STRA|mmetsp:Transcript_46459/g.140729  ORF Transcript_46459/g.140729 Transcript_46459/m.140729 type:complete len:100 (+) Transcript_46459:380-679(+)
MQLSHDAARMSAVTYLSDSAAAACGFSFEGFEDLRFFTEEPGQAVAARKDGRCHFAFRGTKLNVDGWLQKLDFDLTDVHKDNDDTLEFCQVCEGCSDLI